MTAKEDFTIVITSVVAKPRTIKFFENHLCLIMNLKILYKPIELKTIKSKLLLLTE